MYRLLACLVLVACLALPSAALGIPMACPGPNPNAGKIVFPTASEFCTSNNLALAQPRDFAENYAGCVAWFNSSHGGQVLLSVAQAYCTAMKDLYNTEIYYSVCVDPCTGSPFPTAAGCSICTTLSQIAFRRSPIEYGGGKRSGSYYYEGMDVTESYLNYLLYTTNRTAWEIARQTAESTWERHEAFKRGGRTSKPATTKPAGTTAPPPSTPPPVCAVPNPNWPVDYIRCTVVECNYNYGDPCADYAPNTCPSVGGPDQWSLFDYVTTERFRSSNGAPGFWWFFLAWGPVSMTDSASSAGYVNEAARVYFKRIQCTWSGYCSACSTV